MRLPRLRVLPQTLALVVCILALAVGMAATHRDFATLDNAEVVAMGFVLEAFMALGMTLVIVTGGIDLSVGAVLPFSAILTASMLRASPWWCSCVRWNSRCCRGSTASRRAFRGSFRMRRSALR